MKRGEKTFLLLVCALLAGCGAVEKAAVTEEGESSVAAADEQQEQQEQKEGDAEQEPSETDIPPETFLKKITFRSGLSIEGIIVEKSSGKVKVLTEVGTYSFKQKRIRSIEDAEFPGDITGSLQEAEDNGFEAAEEWSLQKWGNKGSVERESGLDGDVRIRLTSEAGEKDKTAIRLENKMDLASWKTFAFDVFNTRTEPVTVAAAFTTGTEWAYYESKAVKIDQGWNRIEIDLASSEFKTQATEWKFEAKIQNISKTTHIFLIVYNGKKEAEVIFDNIGFEVSL